MRIELKMMGKGALIGIRLLWRSILILENLFIDSFSIASSNSSFWPFIMARTKDHVLKSLPVTRQQIASCVDYNKNCLKNEMLTDNTALKTSTMRNRTCSAIGINGSHGDAVIPVLLGKDRTVFYRWLLFYYIHWMGENLWAFTVFFEAMILKWMNLKIMTSGHIVELPVEKCTFPIKSVILCVAWCQCLLR